MNSAVSMNWLHQMLPLPRNTHKVTKSHLSQTSSEESVRNTVTSDGKGRVGVNTW